MPKYRLHQQWSFWTVLEVEAEDEDDALIQCDNIPLPEFCVHCSRQLDTDVQMVEGEFATDIERIDD